MSAAAPASVDITRPDRRQAALIEEALGLWNVSAALGYMAYHGIAAATAMRVLMTGHRRHPAAPPEADSQSVLQQFHVELALDNALAASFPASDPVAISITGADRR